MAMPGWTLVWLAILAPGGWGPGGPLPPPHPMCEAVEVQSGRGCVLLSARGLVGRRLGSSTAHAPGLRGWAFPVSLGALAEDG